MIKFISKEDGHYLQVKSDKNIINDGPSWSEVVEDFQGFLSACGYVFPDGFDMADILEQAHKDYYNVG